MSDGAMGMGRVLSSIGHMGNLSGGGGGSGHVVQLGVEENVQQSFEHALESSGTWRIMGSLCFGFDTIFQPFKTEGFSLGVASQALASLGTLPSPAASLPKPSNLLGKGGGKGV